MPVSSGQKKIQHLYLRTGFGEPISKISAAAKKPLKQNIDEVFNASKEYTGLSLGREFTTPDILEKLSRRKTLSKEEKKMLRKQSRENLRDLNTAWIDKMAKDNAQLREKMTLFWHGHFACRTPIAYYCMQQNNTIRNNALGNFGELLLAVSKDAAMLQFLNNQQNKKSSPNENFARELLELFTLGRGNYTEQDIKEAARAFTGWGFNAKGEYQFRKGQHDFGSKTFMGKTGKLDGEDVINIVLGNRQTAKFIASKVYKYFVNDIIDDGMVSELARDFYDSGYNIEKLMRSIFESDSFYDDVNIGSRIKSPVELVAGMMRTFNIEFENKKPLLAIQQALGQVVFYPPNVAGWAGGKTWIDSSSLMFRLKLPEVIFRSSELEFSYKDDPQEMGEMAPELKGKMKQMYKQLKTRVNLSEYFNALSGKEKNEIFGELSGFILQKQISGSKKDIVESYSDESTKENLIESMILRLISLPEYQLA
jgi:uncharacterized protein (DUF1800 family)